MTGLHVCLRTCLRRARSPVIIHINRAGLYTLPRLISRTPSASLRAGSAQHALCNRSISMSPFSNPSTQQSASEDGDSGASSVIFSENQPADLPPRLSELTATAWTVTPSRMGITRQFTFKSFSAAWRFMSLVAEECKTKRHHPSWHNLYNEVTVEWTTHRPLGLSIKDVEMAEFCDRMADDIGLKNSVPKDT